MASRWLALNLKQAVRSRTALNSLQPFRRGLATPIHQSINTESTTLSNGLTVSLQITCLEVDIDGLVDRYRTLAVGADLDGWCVD